MKKMIIAVVVPFLFYTCSPSIASSVGYWATVRISLPPEDWCTATYWIPDTIPVARGDTLYFGATAEEDEYYCQQMELLSAADTAAEKEKGMRIYFGIVEKLRR